MLLFDITAEFDKQLKEFIGHKVEVHKFLQNHERKRLVLDNICDQVQIYEHKYGTRINKQQRDIIVGEGMKMFCAAALQYKREQLMTDIEKTQRQPKKDEIKEEMQEIFHEVEES